MRKDVLLLGLCMVLMALPVHASSKLKLSIAPSLILPMGDFGDSDSFEDGLAKTGFGIGIEKYFPLKSNNVSIVVNCHYIRNGVDTGELEDEFLSELLALGDDPDVTVNPDVDMDFGSWINIPFLGGIKYETPISPSTNLYFIGLAGMNYSRMGSRIVEYSGEGVVGSGYHSADFHFDGRIESEYDTNTSFGFCLGMGIMLERFNVSVRYYNFGKSDFDGEYSSRFYWYDELTGSETSTDRGDEELEIPVSFLQFQVGINL